jgi:hypothetical protein
MIAINFNFPSIDFLLQYSLFPEAHHIQNHNPHFGLINSIEVAKTIQANNIIIIKKVFIIQKLLNKFTKHNY